MSEVEDAIKDAVRTGYKAAENGENLEDILQNVKVTDGKTSEATA